MMKKFIILSPIFCIMILNAAHDQDNTSPGKFLAINQDSLIDQSIEDTLAQIAKEHPKLSTEDLKRLKPIVEKAYSETNFKSKEFNEFLQNCGQKESCARESFRQSTAYEAGVKALTEKQGDTQKPNTDAPSQQQTEKSATAATPQRENNAKEVNPFYDPMTQTYAENAKTPTGANYLEKATAEGRRLGEEYKSNQEQISKLQSKLEASQASLSSIDHNHAGWGIEEMKIKSEISNLEKNMNSLEGRNNNIITAVQREINNGKSGLSSATQTQMSSMSQGINDPTANTAREEQYKSNEYSQARGSAFKEASGQNINATNQQGATPIAGNNPK